MAFPQVIRPGCARTSSVISAQSHALGAFCKADRLPFVLGENREPIKTASYH